MKTTGQYKALMLDVDGTLVPVRPDTLPSDAVLKALNKAKTRLHVSLVTSRPLFHMHEIFDCVKLSGPSIINGGAQIIDAQTKKILWEQAIERLDLKSIVQIVHGRHPISIIDILQGRKSKFCK